MATHDDPLFLLPGTSGSMVTVLQTGLSLLGYHTGPLDGVYGPFTEHAVSTMQAGFSMCPTGVCDPLTLKQYNALLDQAKDLSLRRDAHAFQVPVHIPNVDPKPGAPMYFKKVPLPSTWDFPEGMIRVPMLREDAAVRFNNAVQELDLLGCSLHIPSSGSKTNLSSLSPGKLTEAVNISALGLSISLPETMGMVSPAFDHYVVTREGRRWEVWIRTRIEDVAPIITLPASKVIHNTNKVGKAYTHLVEVEVEGRFVNLTRILSRHGFEPVRIRSRFLMGGNYAHARWWEFQYVRGLKPNVLFGSELLRVYPEVDLKRWSLWTTVRNLPILLGF